MKRIEANEITGKILAILHKGVFKGAMGLLGGPWVF